MGVFCDQVSLNIMEMVAIRRTRRILLKKVSLFTELV